ncbi:GH25 family lysozyme [Virgibacillus sp. FSP13]
MGAIIDVSHHQRFSKSAYDKLAKQVDLVIVRTQYGSKLIDREYERHHREFQKRGVPTAAYAWVRGVSNNDMEIEATDFYNRTKAHKPTFWFLDVEEKSMSNMRSGISHYVRKLRQLVGNDRIGVYIAHHHYRDFNINTSEFDAVWIPRYGGYEPAYRCDLHQYTQYGELNGYSGNLDLNRIISDKKLSYFTKKGALTMDQYKDLKQENERLKKDIDRLEKMFNKLDKSKLDKRPKNDDAWDSHVEGFDWLKEQDITKGNDPHLFLSKEQFATLLMRYDDKSEYLPDWMYDAIVDQFDGIKDYLKKPDEWKERLKNHDVKVPELLGVLMLSFLRKDEIDARKEVNKGRLGRR